MLFWFLKGGGGVGASSLYIVSFFFFSSVCLSIRITMLSQRLLLIELVEYSQQSLVVAGVTMHTSQKRRDRDEGKGNTTKKWPGGDLNGRPGTQEPRFPVTLSPSLCVYWASTCCPVLCRGSANEQDIFSALNELIVWWT